MKKSDYDFSIPTRQSYAAIVMIIYKFYRIIISQAIPLILILFISRGSSSGWKLQAIYGVVGFAVLAMIYAIIAYFKYYFHIDGDELIVDKGVLQKKRTSIPFDRIQTINIEQNILHQLLNVVKLVVDTAGTSKNEFEFDALSHEKAEALKSYILERKRKKTSKSIGQEVEASEEIEEYRTILTIDVPRLFKIGMTENHLKSGGLIFAFLFWIYESLNDAGVELDTYESQVKESVLAFAMFLVVAFFLISFIVSLVRTVLQHFDLKFLRSETGFAVKSGLLTKKYVAAKDHKIQMLVFSDNLLQKLLGYKDLFFKQASSIELENKKSIKIPGCTQDHISLVTDALYGNRNLEDIEFFPVQINYRNRIWMYLSIAYLVLMIGTYFLDKPWILGVLTMVWLYFMITMYFRYKKMKYGFNHEMIHIKGGVFGDKDTILPLYKIQSVKLSQSPYQRRKKLASIVLNTASGGTSIPYLKQKLALHVMNYLLYKVEVDHRKWM